MPINILMPALSPTMEKGNLAKWLKKEGDTVKSGDVIAEIETDKATMEVEAVDEGTLAQILVPEGTADVPVNQLIAMLARGEGEDAEAALQAGGRPPRPAPPPQRRPLPGERSGQPPASARGRPPPDSRSRLPPSQAGSPTSAPGGEAALERAAGEAGVAPKGNRAAGASSPRRWRAGSPAKPASTCRASKGPARTAASSRATSSGEAGQGAARARSGPRGRRAAAPVLAPSDEAIRALFEEGSYEVVPHDNMRKIIAQRLVEAKQTIPHFYLTVDCKIDALLHAREEINAAAPKDKDGKPAWKLSVNDIVIKALALALLRVPDANVTWTEGGMLKHKHADIGVAVSIPGGLITPVVRNADTKTLSAISDEMKDFAARARTRKLKPEEYQGGSTAVSNLGMFGVKDFAAVINPPHATILAVGAGEERAVVRNGKIEVATQS